MKRLLLIAALLTLPACGVNEWEMSYQTLSEERFAPLRPDANLELVDCSSFADALYLEKVRAAEESARSLGSSRFEINRARGDGSRIQAAYLPDLESFARSIGADLVLFRIVYVDTQRARELETWDIPRTDTHYVTSTVRNPDGSRTRSTTSITTTNWETRLITRTVNIDRFTASAAYFRREDRWRESQPLPGSAASPPDTFERAGWWFGGEESVLGAPETELDDAQSSVRSRSRRRPWRFNCTSGSISHVIAIAIRES